LAFLGVGLYTLVGRPALDRRRRLGTTYAVTTERALVVTADAVTDVPLATTPISVQRLRSGRTTVAFGGPVDRRTAQLMGGVVDRRLRRLGPVPFVFADVVDGDALLAALDRARTDGVRAAERPWAGPAA
jgi:hypothetical protein